MAEHLMLNLPSAAMALTLNFLVSCLIGHLFLSKVEKWKIEVGHLQFVDNFKEGMIILPNNSHKIKLMNKAARTMLKMPETEADDFEERL